MRLSMLTRFILRRFAPNLPPSPVSFSRLSAFVVSNALVSLVVEKRSQKRLSAGATHPFGCSLQPGSFLL